MHTQTQPFLIIGLGNPGKKYAHTRHNAGFIALDFIATRYNTSFSTKKKCHADVAHFQTETLNLILAKPTTFMNNSGIAIGELCAYYKIPLSHIIVVHDESDLPVGKYLLQSGRGGAGHNGVADSITTLNSKDFLRLRVGVRPQMPKDVPHLKAREFVLNNFTPTEKELLMQTLHTAWDAIFIQMTAHNTTNKKSSQKKYTKL